jgi:hypothetical protein
MPRYAFYNPTSCRIYLPGLNRWIGPQKNLTVDAFAVPLDNPGLNSLVVGGHIRMSETVESPKIADGIEVPVVDMLGSGGGGSLPDPTEIGQVIYAENGTDFSVELPITGPFGWLVNDDGILITVG